MGTEGQDGVAGRHIYRQLEDSAAITDDIRVTVREGVDLVRSAHLEPEQLADLIASLREAVNRGTPVEEVPAAQLVPGLEDWARRNKALFATLLVVLGVLLEWGLGQLESDPAPTSVEVDVNHEVVEEPRPSDEEAIDRAINEALRKA
jgi:hypothetical protein